MKWILLLPPTSAAALLLWGVGAMIYVFFLWQPAAHARPLILSEDVTQICIGFTASYCDETVGPATSSPTAGPWKACGAHIISLPPTVPVILATPETSSCPDLHRDAPEGVPLSGPSWQSQSNSDDRKINSVQ
jgi:hypothetical protein